MTVNYSLKFLIMVLLIIITAQVLKLSSYIPYMLLGFSIGAWTPVVMEKILRKGK